MSPKWNKTLLVPVGFSLGFIPLVVYMKEYIVSYQNEEWFPDGIETAYDFFLYYKAAVVVITAAVMLCLLLLNGVKERIKLKINFRSVKIFLPLAAYILFVCYQDCTHRI